MVSDWSQESIVVTGGAGFLGSFVVEELRHRGARDVFIPRSADYDLVDMAAVRRLHADAKPTLVIHMAARVVGGIGANRDNPEKFFYDNLMMGVQLIEVGRQVGLGSSSRSGPSAPTRSSRRCRSRKTTSGTDTPKRRMLRTAWPRRCCSSRARPTGSSTSSTPRSCS